MAEEFKVLAGEGSPEQWQSARLSPVYGEAILAFLQQLSDGLLKLSGPEKHSELVALGFWLRGTHLAQLKPPPQGTLLKPVGNVLHITPNNVDTMFVYSWVCALLMGNRSIVRVGNSQAPVAEALLSSLNQLFNMPQHRAIAQANLFVHYPRDSHWSKTLSAQMDARVLWGGDDSVNSIRALPAKPRCRDIGFADRYSAAIISVTADVSSGQLKSAAEHLWRDTEAYFQQACSSPRMIFWKGDEDSLTCFIDYLAKCAQNAPAPIEWRNNQLVYQQLVKQLAPDTQVLCESDVFMLQVDELSEQMLDWHLGQGCFLVKWLTSVEQVAKYCWPKLQTLAYWGVDKDELIKICSDPSITGIERCVPLGRALAFSPKWDGYDVMMQLSRQVVLE